MANTKKEKITSWDDVHPKKYEYAKLASFGGEEYSLDFCLDDKLPDKYFVLIFDSDPDDGEPIPEADTDTTSELRINKGIA